MSRPCLSSKRFLVAMPSAPLPVVAALMERACWSHHQPPRRPLLEQRRSLEYLIDPSSTPKRGRSDRRAKKQQRSSKPSHRFTDRIRLRCAGGSGGKGSTSQLSIRRRHRLRPDGGHGGNGGSVVIVADPDQQPSLSQSRLHFRAEDGMNGSSRECHGRNGRNLLVRVPAGVVVKRVLNYDEVWDEETRSVRTSTPRMDDDELNAGNSAEEDDGLDFFDDEEDFPCDYDSATDREVIPLADLDEPGSHVVVARGGRGGLGSCLYSSRYALPDAETLVKSAQPGPGEVAFLELELKLIADLGFVGFPNAGKSSLLRALSAATPEVAPYPFTTLHPTVGCIDYRDGFRIRAADIPGLIDGSADGRGKGHDFLRHIERTKALLYMVDGAGTDYRDPVEDLRVLARELASYGDGSLMSRRALVVVNKTDLLHKERVEELISSLEDAAEEIGIEVDDDVLGISAGVTGQGLPSLAEAIRDIVGRSDEDRRLLFSSEESV